MKSNYGNKSIKKKNEEKAKVSVESGRGPQPCSTVYYCCAHPTATRGLVYQAPDRILADLLDV